MAIEASMNQDTNIEQLEKNPMFQLSLTSKELFHSNFLYWLSLYDKNKFKNLIEELAGDKIHWPENPNNWIVLREHKNLDLCIIEYDSEEKEKKKVLKNYLFVLENKVKSIATKKQLDGYYKKVDDTNKEHKCCFCLLSLSVGFLEREEIEKDRKWTIRSYSNLAEALERHYLKDDASSGGQYIIEQYRQSIVLLDEIVKPNMDSMTWVDTAINKKLSKFRIDNFIKKVIGNKLAVEIADKLSEQGGKVEFNVSDSDMWNPKSIFLTAGYTRNGILIHLSKFLSKDDVLIRLEIEGHVYKRGIIKRKEDPKKKTPKEEKDNVPDYPIFVKDILSEERPAIEYPEALKGGWAQKKRIRTYDMKQLMKYQCVNIPKKRTLSEVVAAVVEDFKQICDELIKPSK